MTRFNTHFNSGFIDRTRMALHKRFLYLAPKETVRFTSEEDDQIIEALRLKMTVAEISELLGRKRISIYTRIRKLKKLNRLDEATHVKNPHSYTDAEIKLIHKLRTEGVSWKDIATNHFPGRSSNGIRLKYWRYYDKVKEEEVEKEEDEGKSSEIIDYS